MKKSLPIALLLILLVAACGGNQAAAPTAFPSPTPIPTYRYITVTPVAAIATLAATEAAPGVQTDEAVDPAAITAGQGRYVALTCGSCHGDAGQGGGDLGPALVPMTLNEADFTTVLRSGGKLGSKHQYATNRLSDKGAHNLYLYLLSLGS